MKSVELQVRDEVWRHVWGQALVQGGDQVRGQVEIKVWQPVEGQVWDQVRVQIKGQIKGQINEIS